MPPLGQTQPYVCLPCRLRKTASLRSIQTSATKRHYSFVSQEPYGGLLREKLPKVEARHAHDERSRRLEPAVLVRSHSTTSIDSVRLSTAQASTIGKIHALRQKLEEELSKVPDSDKTTPLPVKTLFAALTPPAQNDALSVFQRMEQVYGEKTFDQVSQDVDMLMQHRRSASKPIKDEESIRLLNILGILDKQKKTEEEKQKMAAARALKKAERAHQTTKPNPVTRRRLQRENKLREKREKRASTKPGKAAQKKTKSEKSVSVRRVPGVRKDPIEDQTARPEGRSLVKSSKSLRAPETAQRLDPALIPFQAISTEDAPQVPRLSFDLSRVLFNPGVYHLQDPRSRVYNFDPYLENIMPVTEFNFGALNPYITSSEDDFLRIVSMEQNKRYVGSSSSMSAAMSHFHFLLSAWRPIDASILSQRITGLDTFTVITRAPASIYLRWRNGVYAVDADKEYDTPNILMMQGKSMEKLLTLEKEDFEKYRKPKAREQAPAVKTDPESYHYSTVENFLLRSQLDAYDPRLPGSGMFDLKTRAVAGIRMNMSEHESGMNYQIKDRFGLWESYDREYYDMIRSAFLKYSIQVRMGRMDGIFVAYHNIARIFGFQYISLPELDMALHGQADPSVGDGEFKLSLKLMNEIFDQATKEFPEQSLRITFETREQSKTEPNGVMRIFAEPMTEEDIDQVQKTGKSKVEDYEKMMADGIDPSKIIVSNVQTLEQKLSSSTLESNAADTKFLDQVLSETKDKDDDVHIEAQPEEKQVGCWTLHIYNEVNGQAVLRPKDITKADRWTVKYVLEQRQGTRWEGLYKATRGRRAATLAGGLESKKNNFFIKKIRDMSESGRVWRQEQNAKDATRGKVMLYALD